MPSNWLTIDTNFPTFTGEESAEQQIRALHNYMFQLREGLQYTLQNLTAENFNATALQNLTDSQKSELTDQLQQVYGLLNQLSSEIDSLSGRVAGSENLSGRMTTAENEISSLKGRMTVAERNIDNLGTRTTDTEGKVTDLQERMQDAETDIGDLRGRATIAEGNIEALGTRVKDLEDAVSGEDGLQAKTQALEDAVTGEGGLTERTEAAEKELQKISGAVQVAEDGSATVGSEGKALHLVGEVYINGVLYGQGGTT